MSKIQKLAMALVVAMGFFTMTPALAQVDPWGGSKETLCQTIGTCESDPRLIAAKIIRSVMGLLGLLAIVIVMIGGFTWMTAGGNEEKVATAKKWLYSGVIGLVIILSAFAITNFVVGGLIQATTGGSSPTI